MNGGLGICVHIGIRIRILSSALVYTMRGMGHVVLLYIMKFEYITGKHA